MINILKNEPLSNHTNFKVGGPADYFVEVKTQEELLEALAKAHELKIPFFMLGGGTNILVGDKGYRGLVIKNRMDQIKIAGFRSSIQKASDVGVKDVFVRSDSGVLLNRLVRYTLEQELSGLENFLGQPGTVGGAMYINAHNMNQHDFFGDHVGEATIINRDGTVETVTQQYFKFGYDESILQKNGATVVSVVVKLAKGTKDAVWEKANAAQNHRHTTQPKGYPTAGCTFRNIAQSEAMRIGTPNHTRSAGFLIDACGLKGKQVGQAMFSKEHANFIVNLGGATAADIRKLIKMAKREVKAKFGVELKEEIVLVGEF